MSLRWSAVELSRALGQPHPPTAEQIASSVVTSAGSGSIILMHLGGYETLDALEIMVPALRERGLLLTSVSDLLN